MVKITYTFSLLPRPSPLSPPSPVHPWPPTTRLCPFLSPLFLSLASSIWMARHHYGCIQLARLPGCVARAIRSVSLLKQLVSESFSIPHNCGKHGKWRMPTSSPLEANYRGYTWIFWENLTTSVFWICPEFQFLKRKNVFSWSRLWWVL